MWEEGAYLGMIKEGTRVVILSPKHFYGMVGTVTCVYAPRAVIRNDSPTFTTQLEVVVNIDLIDKEYRFEINEVEVIDE